jgi:hypothetical protein
LMLLRGSAVASSFNGVAEKLEPSEI